MKIQGISPQSRHERNDFRKRVEVTTPSGTTFEAQSQDISRSGIALSLSAPLMENGMFVELHTEGLGNLSGKVARTYEGGAAVQFDTLLNDDPGSRSGSPTPSLNKST